MDLIKFYRGDAPNTEGWYIEDILDFSDERLETDHKYIQWLFPTLTPSKFNPDAPLLTYDTSLELLACPRCMQNYFAAVGMMLNYWNRTVEWRVERNHNLLRISRLLESLALLRFRGMAQRIYEQMTALPNNEKFISEDTLKYWNLSLNAWFIVDLSEI